MLKILLVLLALSLNYATSFTILSRPLPSVLQQDDEESRLMIEKPPAVSIADIAPIIKKPEEVLETDAEINPKSLESKEEEGDDNVKPSVKHVSAQTPIPHTGNIDNANLLEYSAPNLSNGNKKHHPIKHAGKDGDNAIDYNDYVTLPIDVFKQQL